MVNAFQQNMPNPRTEISFEDCGFEEDYLMPQRRSTKSFSPPIATKQLMNIPLLLRHGPTCCCEVSQGVVVADNSLLLAVALAQAAVEAEGGHWAPNVVLTMY